MAHDRSFVVIRTRDVPAEWTRVNGGMIPREGETLPSLRNWGAGASCSHYHIAAMQWSQLKHRVEEQFAPSLRGRLQIRYTVYRNLTEGDGRARFTWDGEEIYGLEDRPGNRKMDARLELWREQGVGARENAATGSYHGAREFLGTLHDYLRTPFADLLASPDPITRGLALADRRLGKRRFEKLAPEDIAHPLVQRVHTLRAEAEGWSAGPSRRSSEE